MSDWLASDELEPQPSPWMADFYEATAAGRLVVPMCGSCDVPWEFDQRMCAACSHRGVSWREVERRGRVHATTVVHRLERPSVVAPSPYPVIDVEFETGHRLVLTTSGAQTSTFPIGTTVEIGFRTVGAYVVPAVSGAADDMGRKP